MLPENNGPSFVDMMTIYAIVGYGIYLINSYFGVL